MKTVLAPQAFLLSISLSLFACKTPQRGDYRLPLDEPGIATEPETHGETTTSDVDSDAVSNGPAFLYYRAHHPKQDNDSSNTIASEDDLLREDFLVCRRYCEEVTTDSKGATSCKVETTKAINAHELLSIAKTDDEKRALGFLLADITYRPNLVAGSVNKEVVKSLFSRLNEKFDRSEAAPESCNVTIITTETELFDEEAVFYNQ